MKLSTFLSAKRSVILEKWFEEILDTYPSATSSFLKKQNDPFTNPVGQNILHGIEGLFDELLHWVRPDKASPFLDNIIRIRAIQDFTPSQAISFIFSLKKVIREELKNDPGLNSIQNNSGLENRIAEELLTLEDKIDGLALLAFDIYMKCREKIYDLKANEVKNMTFGLLKRAKLICDSEFNSGQRQ